jgi:hypothetical protein
VKLYIPWKNNDKIFLLQLGMEFVAPQSIISCGHGGPRVHVPPLGYIFISFKKLYKNMIFANYKFDNLVNGLCTFYYRI